MSDSGPWAFIERTCFLCRHFMPAMLADFFFFFKWECPDGHVVVRYRDATCFNTHPVWTTLWNRQTSQWGPHSSQHPLLNTGLMRDFPRGAAGARLGLRGWGRGVLGVHNSQHLKLCFICWLRCDQAWGIYRFFHCCGWEASAPPHPPPPPPHVSACVSFVDFPPFQPTLTGLCALDLSRVAALRDLGTSMSSCSSHVSRAFTKSYPRDTT